MTSEVLFLGCGNMGYAIAKNLLTSKTFQPHQICILGRSIERLTFLQKDLKCFATQNPKEIPIPPEVIILAVKPQNYTQALTQLPTGWISNQKILSVMAGVSIKNLEKLLPQAKIARVMPNTPSILGAGMSVFYAPKWNLAEKEKITRIFGSLGETLEVTKEDALNTCVPISGSGPGFLFFFAEIFKQQAQDFGFSEEQADLLTRQTFYGAGLMLKNFPAKTITELKAEVTSPNGSTFAGLQEFEKQNLPEKVKLGLKKSYLRSKELGDM